MQRWTAAGVVGLFMTGVAPTLAGDGRGEAAGEPALVVRVADYARLRADILGQAVQLARSVLGQAGVATEWRASIKTAESAPRDSEEGVGTELTLEIFGRGQTHALAPWPDVLGFALLPKSEGEGLYGVVFVDKAAALARQSGVPLPLVLGHAMAHEIGHLLLGTRDHSATGLMRARWSSQELQRAAWGRLHFTEQEAARVRTAIAGGPAAPGSRSLLTALAISPAESAQD